MAKQIQGLSKQNPWWTPVEPLAPLSKETGFDKELIAKFTWENPKANLKKIINSRNPYLTITITEEKSDERLLGNTDDAEARKYEGLARDAEAQALQHEEQARRLRREALTYKAVANAYSKTYFFNENFEESTFDQKPLPTEKPFWK